jgi:hypothetical protein
MIYWLRAERLLDVRIDRLCGNHILSYSTRLNDGSDFDKVIRTALEHPLRCLECRLKRPVLVGTKYTLIRRQDTELNEAALRTQSQPPNDVELAPHQERRCISRPSTPDDFNALSGESQWGAEWAAVPGVPRPASPASAVRLLSGGVRPFSARSSWLRAPSPPLTITTARKGLREVNSCGAFLPSHALYGGAWSQPHSFG